jgi:hypothetical protein
MQLHFLRRPVVASILALAIGPVVAAVAWPATRRKILNAPGKLAHRCARPGADYESRLRVLAPRRPA